MTFEWVRYAMLLSAIPPTVAHSVALLADDTGRPETTDETVTNRLTIGRTILTLSSVIIRCVYRAELILGR